MLHQPPPTPVENLIEDLQDWVKCFPKGVLLKYNGNGKFDCIYDIKRNKYTSSEDIIGSIETATHMICHECGGTNTELKGFSGVQSDFSPVDVDVFECFDCGFCENR